MTTTDHQGRGWCLVDAQGVLLAVDGAFCALVGLPEGVLVGANMLDFTAPADRKGCRTLLRTIIDDPADLTTTKRIIKADGTHLWVRSDLSRSARHRDPQCYEISIVPIRPPHDRVEPSRLLHIARMIAAGRRERHAVFGAEMFTDAAWDILIIAYIREMEGKTVSIATLHAGIGLSLSNASRWLRALAAAGLVEYENGGSVSLVTAPFRLSTEGHDRFERVMGGIHRLLSDPERVEGE